VVLAHLWIGRISIQGGRRAVCLGLWLIAGTRLQVISALSYMFLLQPAAAASLVLVDTRVANGCVVEVTN
jgi:hypothetical protein